MILILYLLWILQSDAYQATGCYNLLCSGFIQINNQIAMGASIFPISNYGGSQYDINILVWKVNSKKLSHAEHTKSNSRMGPDRIRAHLSLVLSEGTFRLESRLQLWPWPCLWTYSSQSQLSPWIIQKKKQLSPCRN